MVEGFSSLYEGELLVEVSNYGGSVFGFLELVCRGSELRRWSQFRQKNLSGSRILESGEQ